MNNRPKDDGNLPKLDSKPKFREMVILESDVLKTVIDNASATVQYTCKAECGTGTDEPNWQISRLTTSGNIITEEWADGDGFFDNICDNRETLTYK